MGRFVRDNKTTRLPGAHVAFDCETFSTETALDGVVAQRFRLACATYWRIEKGSVRSRKSVATDSAEELRDWIRARLSPRRSTWVWAHNLIFDFTISDLWQWLDDGSFSLYSPGQVEAISRLPEEEHGERPRGYLCLSDPPTILSGWVDGCRCVFVDSYNWLATSLAKIGDWCELPKLKIPRDTADQEDWFAYCKRDVEILERAVNRILGVVRDCDLGVLKPTAASQSFQHWRPLKDRPSVQLPASKAEARLARDSYYGGRAECFWVGPRQGPVYHLDLNGAYAWAMLRRPQPRQLIDYVDFACEKDLRALGEFPCLSATAKLKTRCAYPVRKPGKPVEYAIGEYWTDLCGEELRRAWEGGDIVGIRRLARYELDRVNASFAEFWVARRNEWRANGDKVLEQLAKSMPCSLYGRWAQRASTWEEVGDVREDRRWGSFRFRDCSSGEWFPGRIIAGRAEIDTARAVPVVHGRDGPRLRVEGRRANDNSVGKSFPAISAWITSAVRCRMDRVRDCAGRENYLWQNVDACMVTKPGFDRLCASNWLHDTDVGALKLVGIYKRVELWAPNCIRIDGVLKAAGLPGKHWERPDGVLEATTFERANSILDRGPDGTVRTTTCPWLAPIPKAGEQLPEGRWAEPIVLGR